MSGSGSGSPTPADELTALIDRLMTTDAPTAALTYLAAQLETIAQRDAVSFYLIMGALTSAAEYSEMGRGTAPALIRRQLEALSYFETN